LQKWGHGWKFCIYDDALRPFWKILTLAWNGGEVDFTIVKGNVWNVIICQIMGTDPGAHVHFGTFHRILLGEIWEHWEKTYWICLSIAHSKAIFKVEFL